MRSITFIFKWLEYHIVIYIEISVGRKNYWRICTSDTGSHWTWRFRIPRAGWVGAGLVLVRHLQVWWADWYSVLCLHLFLVDTRNLAASGSTYYLLNQRFSQQLREIIIGFTRCQIVFMKLNDYKPHYQIYDLYIIETQRAP